MGDGRNSDELAERISRLEDLCDEVLEMVAALNDGEAEAHQTAVA